MISPDEILLIVDMLDQGRTVKQIAYELGRQEPAIRRISRKYHPTTALAERLIRASALTLAEKVVKHSTVEEAIDVLSRPNIGVLKPAAKDNSINVGFFTSVALDSCGAVKSIPNGVQGQVSDALQIEGEVVPQQDTGIARGSTERRPSRRPTPRGDSAWTPPGEGGSSGASQEISGLVVGPPTGYTPSATPDIARARLKKRTPKFIDPHPSRKAILKLAKGHTTKDKDSSIHLRYDI